MADSVFDRLRRSKYGYVATGWTTFIDNLAKNPDIAEVIKNDRDFFAHNEAVQSAKDVGKLRRAIKAAIGRAGAIAYMEQRRKAEESGEYPKCPDQEWRWQDFTSRAIDAGLSIPKGERHMWVLNCGTLKKGERIKLPGTKQEYEVLSVDSGGAKISGLGYISAQTEALVWRPGAGFAEQRTEAPPKREMIVTGESGVRTISSEELEAMKAKKQVAETRDRKAETADRKGKGETEMVKPTRAASSKKRTTAAQTTAKNTRPAADPEPEPDENPWYQNDGQTPLRFGTPVRRGKMLGKVIRADGSKIRVRLANDEGTVEWKAEDKSIYWQDPIKVRDEEEKAEPVPTTEKEKAKARTKPAAEPEPEEEEDDEEEEIEDPDEDEDEDDDLDEEEEDDEIDPDDLPDDDDDLLADNEVDELDENGEGPGPFGQALGYNEDEEEEDDEDPEEVDDGGDGDVAGDDKREYIYSGKDLEELAGVEYQRIQRLKANGVLDGTFLVADNGRVMYSFEAVEIVKNAPRNKPGRPPGGGKKRVDKHVGGQGRYLTPKPESKPASSKPDPRQQTISEIAKGTAVAAEKREQRADKATKEHTNQSTVTFVTKSTSGIRTAADIFAETIDELAVQIARREQELAELKKAMEALEGLAKRNR